MIDVGINAGFIFELVFLAVVSLAILALIIYIFSKPFRILLFMLRGKRVRAEVIFGEMDDSGEVPQISVPTAVYEDENGAHAIILRKDDFLSYTARFKAGSGDKITVYVNSDGEFTTVMFLFHSLVTAILLAAMPVFLFVGVAGMLYYEITDYGVIYQIRDALEGTFQK